MSRPEDVEAAEASRAALEAGIPRYRVEARFVIAEARPCIGGDHPLLVDEVFTSQSVAILRCAELNGAVATHHE